MAGADPVPARLWRRLSRTAGANRSGGHRRAPAAFLMLRSSRSDRAQLVPNLLFSFSSTATTTVMILFIIIEVGIFSYFLTLVQIPQIVAQAIVELPAAACLCPSRHCSISRSTCFSMPSPCWPSSCRSSSRPYRSGLRSDLVQHSVCENARNRIDAPAVGLNCLVIAGIDRDTSLSPTFSAAPSGSWSWKCSRSG